MLSCWEMDPSLRPLFSECKRRLGRYLEDTDATTYSFIKHQLSKEWSLQANVAKTNLNNCEDTNLPPEGPSRKSDNVSNLKVEPESGLMTNDETFQHEQIPLLNLNESQEIYVGDTAMESENYKLP